MSEAGEGLGYVPTDIKEEAAEAAAVDIDSRGERADVPPPPQIIEVEEADLTVLYEDKGGGAGDLQTETILIEGGGQVEEESAPEEEESFPAPPTEREELFKNLSLQRQIFRLSERLLDLIEDSLAGSNNLDEMGETLASLEEELEALAEEIEFLGARLGGRVKSYFVNVRLMFRRLKRVHAVASGRETGTFIKPDEEFEQSLLIALQDQEMSSLAGGGARRLVMAAVHARRAAISEVKQWGSHVSP